MENSAPEVQRLKLTGRQKQILELLCYGRSHQQIAGQLNLSLPTVGSHMKSIYRKLNVHNRGSAVAMALGYSLVELSGSRLNQCIRENYLAQVANRKERIKAIFANATSPGTARFCDSASLGLILKTQS